MRISRLAVSYLIILTLSACGGGDQSDAERKTAQDAARNGKVECALSGSARFERICTTEQSAGGDGQILVIRHPDGGFRRFNILTDGRGLVPADGFDETRIIVLDKGLIEVSSGDDKYRLPAQIKGNLSESGKDAG